MQIDNAEIMKLLQSQGMSEQSQQAHTELPDKVDNDKHAGLLQSSASIRKT